MAKSVVGLFDTSQDAQGAVQELRNAGFSADDISVVANNARGDYDVRDGGGSEAAEGAGAGATGGAVLGGLAGLLVGLGALAIPGVGPVVAAGTLATTLGTTAAGAGLGAAAGGLVGALVGAGIPENDANVYAEGVRRGGALVTVQAANDDDADRAADIMDSHNVVDIDERQASYREGGWNRFDENAGPYEGTGAATRDTGYSDTGRETGSSGTTDTARGDWEESSKVGTGGGAAAGAATGAAVGSVGGPVGTAVGGLAGAVTGAAAGAGGDIAGERYSESRGSGSDDDTSGTTDTGRGDYGTTDTGTSDTAAMGSATNVGFSDQAGGSDYSTTDRGTTDYASARDTGATTDYSTSDRGATGYAGTETTRSGFQSGTQDIGSAEGEQVLPVVEDDGRVGTREVEGGGVRVNTGVQERPVEQKGNLRDETVNVERRPVDRPVDAGTIPDAFQEGTFEVRELDEEPVVDKQARVVEEVVVNKDVDQRTETVRDTARRTNVDVEQIPGETRSAGYDERSGTSGSSAAYQDTASMAGSSSTRYDDASSRREDEGPIEGTLGNAESAAERTTGADLNRSGDVGDRDRRDHY